MNYSVSLNTIIFYKFQENKIYLKVLKKQK